MKIYGMLYSILEMIMIKNRYKPMESVREYIMFGENTIPINRSVKISEPYKIPSRNIGYLPFETAVAYSRTSNKSKVILYLYLRIIENHNEKRLDDVTDYSMNVKCSIAEIAEDTRISKVTVYKIIDELSRPDEGEDFPVIFEEKDGSFSLSYLFCPFSDLNDVLYHEEKNAKKYFEKYGTEEERKMWKNISVMEDTKRMNLDEFADVMTGKFEKGLSNRRWIFGYVYEILKDEKDPYVTEFHIDYKELMAWIRKRSGKVPSESYLRKSVCTIAKAKIFVLSRKTVRGKIMYRLNKGKAIINRKY